MAQAGALLRGSAAFDRSSIAQGLNPERAVGGDVADDLCCPICSNVVAFGAASYTPCHHVYCATCLAEWMERGKATCPSCNSHMETGSVRMLQEAAPVVHRLLGKLQVRNSITAVLHVWLVGMRSCLVGQRKATLYHFAVWNTPCTCASTSNPSHPPQVTCSLVGRN